jgi:peptidoglycan/LPS O-acetylase OafA/YrhL
VIATTEKTTVQPNTLHRVRGLDGIRFALALCVTIGHIGLPVDVDPSSYQKPWNYAAAVYANAFNGPAAVVCFFLISGFCIHFPFRNQPVDLLSYFARRHVRIWTPILTALLLARFVGYKTSLLGDSILWSLIAEEIYYLIYPWLLASSRRFGWHMLLILSTVMAIAIALTNTSAKDYPSFGYSGNWILGLPVWISGCILADHFGQLAQRPRRILFWRLGLVATFVLTSVARFHLGIGYPWSLSVASIYFWFWLKAEIIYYQAIEPLAWLERLGKLTYSLYLTHLILFHILKMTFGDLPASVPLRLFYLTLILLGAAAFYVVIESPSHRLARWLGNRLSKTSR